MINLNIPKQQLIINCLENYQIYTQNNFKSS